MKYRYKVWVTNPRYFDTLKDARAYAQYHFVKTGDIVAVTQVKSRKRG